MKSEIPGITAAHAYITDECRTNRGEEGALSESLLRLYNEAKECFKGNPIGRGTRFHVVLTVERLEPEEGESDAESRADLQPTQ